MQGFRYKYIIFGVMIVSMLLSCSVGRFIPDNAYYLQDLKIESNERGWKNASVHPYVKQSTNTKWFSLFKVPMGVYALSGKDSTKWINKTLQRMGEKPVLYDSVMAQLSVNDLTLAMQNQGFLRAKTRVSTQISGKKLKATYHLMPGEMYYVGKVEYDIQDKEIERILQDNGHLLTNGLLKRGTPFNVSILDQERARITKLLLDSGFYRFHKDFIVYEADSMTHSNDISLVLRLLKYRVNDDSHEENHPRYYIHKVKYSTNDVSGIRIRKSILQYSTNIKEDKPFSARDLQKTYNNFGRLQAIKYTNINFTEVPDTNLLDCEIQLSHRKTSTISFQPEGTNTAGDLGAVALLTYQNRNLFCGSEVLSIQLRSAFEAITGLEGYKDQNYQEYGAEAKLMFPRFVAPFLSDAFRRRDGATSEVSISYNMQNRPEFHRRVFSNTWRYRWQDSRNILNYRFDLLDLNYIYMPWISDTFKTDYLDNIGTRNAILRYNYESLLIMKLGFGLTYNDGTNALLANIETSGNTLDGMSKVLQMETNEAGQRTLFNTAFAQYVKADFDYTRVVSFDTNNSLALHVGLGIAYPYGNSSVLPFEKRYFAGGANSVRGWSVRGLGPGKFCGTDGRIDFINQTGDMKLNLNMEYRTKLFWKFNGAAFIDAGNVWTIRNYEDQPGGQFIWNKFYQQIAVSYGLGLRLNFDYFILRLDMGVKAINPAYQTKEEHYPLLSPNWNRDLTFHFAVGLPF